MADLVGHLPADGLRDVDLDRVAVGDPPLHVGDGADGPAGNVVAVTAWDRVTVLLGHPVAPWAATSLVLLLLLLLLLPPLLLVPEGGGPLAPVAAVALSDIRGGALLLVGLLTHLEGSNINVHSVRTVLDTSRPCPAWQCSTGSLTTWSPHSCSVLKIFFLNSHCLQCIVVTVV